jgi:hypothetical protein
VIEIFLIFLALANRRKRKKCISCLVNDGVTLSENKDMLEHVMGFIRIFLAKNRGAISS